MDFIELGLQAQDLAVLRRFYGDVLGLPVLDGPGGALVVQAGTTRLLFEAAPTGVAPLYHFAFDIPHNQFEAAHAWLLARVPLLKQGAVQDTFHFEAWNAHACYFADPAGNILELIARHNLGNASDQPFGPQAFLRVSEIGVPGPTVAQVAHALAEGPGLALWSGDCEAFAAVGDERGLFICVPEGHPWLPDLRAPAEPFPVRAVIAGAQAATYVIPDLPYTVETVCLSESA